MKDINREQRPQTTAKGKLIQPLTQPNTHKNINTDKDPSHKSVGQTNTQTKQPVKENKYQPPRPKTAPSLAAPGRNTTTGAAPQKQRTGPRPIIGSRPRRTLSAGKGGVRERAGRLRRRPNGAFQQCTAHINSLAQGLPRRRTKSGVTSRPRERGGRVRARARETDIEAREPSRGTGLGSSAPFRSVN